MPTQYVQGVKILLKERRDSKENLDTFVLTSCSCYIYVTKSYYTSPKAPGPVVVPVSYGSLFIPTLLYKSTGVYITYIICMQVPFHLWINAGHCLWYKLQQKGGSYFCPILSTIITDYLSRLDHFYHQKEGWLPKLMHSSKSNK